MAEETYTAAEIVAATGKVMREYKPYLVAAALRCAGGERFTLAQARKIVDEFAAKKV